MILFFRRSGSTVFLVSFLFLLELVHQSTALAGLRGNERELEGDPGAADEPCGGIICNKQKEECVSDVCACKRGYFRNATSGVCEDEDICIDDYPCPVDYASTTSSFCVDYDPPQEYKCGCLDGFEAILPENDSLITEPVNITWRPVACLDQNECLLGTHNCDASTTCENTIGSFICVATTTTITPTTTTPPPPLEGSMTDVCGDKICDTDGLNEECGEDVLGNKACVCLKGYERHSNHCRKIEINSCDSNPCDENASCDDIPGDDYICTCNPGYVGGGRHPGDCILTPAPSTMPSEQPSAAPVVPQIEQAVPAPRPFVVTPPAKECTADSDPVCGDLVCTTDDKCGVCRNTADCDGDFEQCVTVPGDSDASCVELEPGDIAFLCIQACKNSGRRCEDSFAFIAMVDIPADYEIHFTDNRYRTGMGKLDDNEGILTWTAPSDQLAGTVVESLSNPGDFNVEGNFNLGFHNGDSILAYIGTAEMPLFIAGINAKNDRFKNERYGTGLPLELEEGVTAIAIGATDHHHVYARYSGSTISGTKDELLPVFNDWHLWRGKHTNEQYWRDGECTRKHAAPYNIVKETPLPDYQPGDIAFLCVRGDPMEAFSFVALTELMAGTTIIITDNGVRLRDQKTFRAKEGTISFTPDSNIPAGTVVDWEEGVVSDTFSLRSGRFNPTSELVFNGDQLIAYQGTDTDPFFITAVNYDGGFNTPGNGQPVTQDDRSALPFGLKLKGMGGPGPATAVELDNDRDNAWRERGGINKVGTKRQLLNRIYEPNKWESSDNPSNIRCINGGFDVTT